MRDIHNIAAAVREANARNVDRQARRRRWKQPLLKAATVTALCTLVGTSAAEVYTPVKLVLFGISLAWVFGFFIANR